MGPEGLLDELIERSPVGVQVLDRNGLTLRVNNAWLSLFGYASRKQVEGIVNPLENAAPGGAGLRGYINRALGGETVETPLIPVSAGGTRTPKVHASIVPLTGEDDCPCILIQYGEEAETGAVSLDSRSGYLSGVPAACRRIAGARSAASAVEAILNAAIDVLGADAAGVWTLDTAAALYCRGQRGLPNDAAARLTAALAKMPAADALHGSEQPRAVSGEGVGGAWSEIADTLEGAGFGTAIGVPMQPNGSVAGLFILCRRSDTGPAFHGDTARLIADLASVALQNAQLLEQVRAGRDEMAGQAVSGDEEIASMHQTALSTERLAAIGFLAREMAHGLRNPLNVISTSTYYLRQRTPRGDAKIDNHFDAVVGAVSQASDLITNLVTLAGGVTPVLADLNVNEVVQRAILERPTIGDVPLEVTYAEESTVVRADWAQLLQAVRALLTNASVAHEAIPVKVTTERSADEVIVSVGDDRPAMTESETDAVFDTFVAKPTRWTGLALNVARQVALRHKGSVTVETDGPITWFRLRLPVASPGG